MKFTTLVVLASAVLAFEPVRVDFIVKRGNTFSEANDELPTLKKRDDGTGNMVMSNMQTYYLANLTLGSNQNTVGVLVDTGSSDLWVQSHDVDCLVSTYSKRDLDFTRTFNHPMHKRDDEPASGTLEDDETPSNTKGNWNPFAFTTYLFTTQVAPTGDVTGSADPSGACTKLGSFATGQSDSWKENNTDPFYISYADNSAAQGVWGHDTVGVGNFSVENLSFAVANKSSSDIGVLGIGLQGLQSSKNPYSNLPMKMKEQGLIGKVLYSLYLERQDAATGSVLFGGVDHAKYEDSLLIVPVVSSDSSVKTPYRLQVTLDGISLSGSNNQSITITENAYPALLDSGTTLTYMPTALVESIANALGAQFSDSQQKYIMNCVTDENAFVEFNFSGKIIRAPVSDMQLPITKNEKTCMLGIMEKESSGSTRGVEYLVLGDNFLRNAYIVYDLENMEIALAQAKYTKDEDIQVVTGNISGAQSASGVATSFTSHSESTSGGHLNVDGGSSGSGGKKNSGVSLAVGWLTMFGALVAGTLLV